MMMQTELKLSVIIPVYNQAKLISSALLSIPMENCYIEAIVIDDGSTDGTYDAVEYWKKTWSNLKVVHFNENKGVASAVNLGLDLACVDYVVLLGSDDYFVEDLRKCFEWLDGTDLIYFNLIDNAGKIWRVNEKTKRGLCGSVKFMRREFVGDTRCPVEKRWAEDLDFYNQLLAKNPTEKFTDKVVKHYNFPRKGSLTDQMLSCKK